MIMIEQKIYRDCGQLGWDSTMKEIAEHLQGRGHGMGISLVGKHGFGKSTVLEVIARSDKDRLVVEGDMLLQFAYAAMKSAPLSMKLYETQKDPSIGHCWKSPEVEKHQTEAWLVKNHYLDRIDLMTNFSREAVETWVILPDYTMYVKNLKRRTAAMLKDPLWRGYDASHWPVLTWPEFRTWEVEAWSKFTNVRGVIPNLGPESDAVWLKWWETVKLRFSHNGTK
jgi:hypothetical protein